MEGLKNMDGKPKLIYSDEEGSLFSSTITDYLKEEKIELHTTRGHPAFGERFIRTFKDMLFKRLDADEKKGKNNIQWTDYILEILLTYNNKLVGSITKMTPLEARKKNNEFEVKLNISMNARKNRLYPELDIGDKVKIMRKKGISEKERTSHWLKAVHTVEKIDTKLGQTYYSVSDYPTLLLRHETLKL